MGALATILLVVGYILLGVGGLWLIITAFQTSIGWGLGSLLFWPVALAFVVMHWDTAKKPFLTELVGIPFLVGGMFLAGAH